MNIHRVKIDSHSPTCMVKTHRDHQNYIYSRVNLRHAISNDINYAIAVVIKYEYTLEVNKV